VRFVTEDDAPLFSEFVIASENTAFVAQEVKLI